jgi:hypothetical protein
VFPILEVVALRPQSYFFLAGRASARPFREFLDAALAAEADIGCGITELSTSATTSA